MLLSLLLSCGVAEPEPKKILADPPVLKVPAPPTDPPPIRSPAPIVDPVGSLGAKAEPAMKTTFDDANAAKVKETVRRYAGQMKYCHERRLVENPELAGRVELGWSIVGGGVESVYVVGNDTTDNELAACMVKKVKRWKFDMDLEGDVAWPFVFRPAQPTE